MDKELIRLSEKLKEDELTIVISKAGEIIFSSKERGIKPILNILRENKLNLEGAFLADKVIGKAAALLICRAKVGFVYTAVISEVAEKVFKDFGVDYHFEKKVPNIINRDKTDICPMEKRVLDIDSPEEAYGIFDEMIK